MKNKKPRYRSNEIWTKEADRLLTEMAINYCLMCPNCDRKMPNVNFRKRKGCKWCMK
jgi:hypothetical protein